MSENQGNPTPINPNVETIKYKGEDRPRRSLHLDQIGAALAKAQGAIVNAEKDGAGNYGAYSTLAATWVSIRKPLADNGIAVYQRPMKIDGKPNMVTMLLHSSGQFIDDSELEMIFDGGGRMNAMQAMGSAVTYSRRYTLQAATGVAPQDDDDGAGSGDAKNQAKQNQQANKTQGNQNRAPANNKPKDEPKKTEQKPATAADYIMPEWGGSSKGKALRDVETPILEKLKEHLAGRMKEKPKPANIGEIATAYAHIKAVIVDRSPPPPDDIPENVNPNTGEFHPEDEPQPFPPDETEPAGPTIDDFVIPKGVLEALDPIAGIPLKQISEKELRAAQKILDEEMKKGPKGKITAAAGFELRNKITEFFNSMGG